MVTPVASCPPSWRRPISSSSLMPAAFVLQGSSPRGAARSTLRCSACSVSPFCRPAFFGGFDDSSAALRAQVSLARLAITAWRCYFCQGTLPRYLPKSRYGAIDGRSLRLKLRNDILDVIHSNSFLWQLKWDLSNPATLVANCLLQSYDTMVSGGVAPTLRGGQESLESVSRPWASPSLLSLAV